MNILVLGLDHWIQRHQDNDAERNQARRGFERSIQQLIAERGVELVAEEAGDDNEVAQGLQREENAWAPFENREPRRIEPVETIARTVTRVRDGCLHTDIRPRGNWPDPRVPEYEQAMLDAIQDTIGNADSVLILCGEFHWRNIADALLQNGWNVESHGFDWIVQQQQAQDR
jgi:hypothetical protein